MPYCTQSSSPPSSPLTNSLSLPRPSPPLVLCSLNSITKETAIVAMILGRPSPDPGLGPSIELCSRHAPGLVDLSRIGKTLARQRIAAKEPPPALLQVEPAGPFGNEDL